MHIYVCNTIQTAVYIILLYACIACGYIHIIIINRYIREKQSKCMQSVVVCGVQYTNIYLLFRLSNFIYV